MVLEVVDLLIPEGKQREFEQAVQLGVENAIAQSKGFISYQVRQSIETPERYLVTIEWETLEDHTIGFRESELFAVWRSFVGPFFAAPPTVEHFELRVG